MRLDVRTRPTTRERPTDSMPFATPPAVGLRVDGMGDSHSTSGRQLRPTVGRRTAAPFAQPSATPTGGRMAVRHAVRRSRSPDGEAVHWRTAWRTLASGHVRTDVFGCDFP
jgi:hypothetical protein